MPPPPPMPSENAPCPPRPNFSSNDDPAEMDVEIFFVVLKVVVLLCPLGDTWEPGKTTLFPRWNFCIVVVIFFPCKEEDDEQQNEEVIIELLLKLPRTTQTRSL